jgi:hypothetical protein
VSECQRKRHQSNFFHLLLRSPNEALSHCAGWAPLRTSDSDFAGTKNREDSPIIRNDPNGSIWCMNHRQFTRTTRPLINQPRCTGEHVEIKWIWDSNPDPLILGSAFVTLENVSYSGNIMQSMHEPLNNPETKQSFLISHSFCKRSSQTTAVHLSVNTFSFRWSRHHKKWSRLIRNTQLV